MEAWAEIKNRFAVLGSYRLLSLNSVLDSVPSCTSNSRPTVDLLQLYAFSQ